MLPPALRATPLANEGGLGFYFLLRSEENLPYVTTKYKN